MSSSPPERTSGLRQRKKAQTRRAIQEHALQLFLANGYNATTVDEIASAAGVSHMTFFRYFGSKEAVVDTDDYDPLIAEVIRQRPREEDPLTAIHHALLEGLAQVYAANRDALLLRTQLMLRTPELRSRLWENQYATQRLFADALAARAHQEASTLDIRALAAAALATVTTALVTWADEDGAQDLPTLVDRAFLALHTHNERDN